jgi:NAD(P)-dependent dehydrogenase (short-subunit alcohol dehydrogenase family)
VNLAGRTILVTGGTSGTGLAVAAAAHRLGAAVCIGSRSRDSYEEAAARVGSDRVRPFLADIGDPASLDRAVDAIADARLTDVVHCAAGGLEPLLRPLLRATAALRRTEPGPEREAAIARHREELDRLVHENAAAAFAVNDEGPRRLLERLAPALPDGARVIVFSSLWSEGVRRGECPAFYWSVAESKTRFEEWLDARAREWNPRIGAAVLVGHLISDTSMGKLIDRNLLPLMAPEDVASFRAGYVTSEEAAEATIEALTMPIEPGALRRYYLVGSPRLTTDPDPTIMAVVGRMPL